VVAVTYDHELTLIGQRIEEDEIGNQIPAETETTVLCGLKSVGRSEFYDAAASGLRPELVFVIHSYEYSGERVVKFQGVRYNVIRTYQVDFEEMELVCERVVGSG
jgi:SPP1 family predicted phage head-tail adaptor